MTRVLQDFVCFECGSTTEPGSIYIDPQHGFIAICNKCRVKHPELYED